MKRLILHIGAPKCGSSSLQSYLSFHFTGRIPLRNKDGESVVYAAISQSKVLLGPDLLNAAQRSPERYHRSTRLSMIDQKTFHERIVELKQLTEGIDTVVLSCEGWARESHHDSSKCFKDLGVPIDLLFVVRPPVDLMNAGWWQWGAWSGSSVEDWCAKSVGIVRFMPPLSAWTKLLAGAQVKLVELSQDPVLQSLRFLGFDPSELPKPMRINESTNANLLRHLIRMQAHYGRTMHNPGIEFRLNNILRLKKDRPPLVISPELARFIIVKVLDSSRQIMEILSREYSLEDSVVRRYLEPDSYAESEWVAYDEWISQGNSDEFVSELIDKLRRLAPLQAQQQRTR